MYAGKKNAHHERHTRGSSSSYLVDAIRPPLYCLNYSRWFSFVNRSTGSNKTAVTPKELNICVVSIRHPHYIAKWRETRTHTHTSAVCMCICVLRARAAALDGK